MNSMSPTLSLSLPLSHDVFVERSGHRVGQLGSLQQSGHCDGEWRGQLSRIEHAKCLFNDSETTDFFLVI